MQILSLDPGIRACGVALWDDAELRHAAWVRTTAAPEAKGIAAWVAMGWAVRRYLEPFWKRDERLIYVAEIPQIYQQRRVNADLDDLPPLAGVATAVAALLSEARGAALAEILSYYPREWKKQVPKDIMTARIQARLKPEEAARVQLPVGRKQEVGVAAHNVYDAIGIGLYFLKVRRLRGLGDL